ncbi:MAG: hypothetical protein KatS3mg038_1655 [Candidatus Kapaibacterium sp.]|nr:MAG: hypothetical protein KatS3mg038_1655 [Candidatus Kapabacteria bacterium]
MKVAVIRPCAAGWLFRQRLRVELFDQAQPPQLRVVAAPRGRSPRELRRRPGGGAGRHRRRCMTTPPGSSSCQALELRHGIGRTCWDGRISSASLAAAARSRTPWQPGDPAPPGSGLSVLGELLEMWRAIYLRLAEELSQERYGPHGPNASRSSSHCCARLSSRSRYPMKPIGRPIPIKVPRRRPAEAAAEKGPRKPAKVPAGKP